MTSEEVQTVRVRGAELVAKLKNGTINQAEKDELFLLIARLHFD